jgi:hypothetical protein
MTRISTFCFLSSTLAVLALSANGASAENITVHTLTPPAVKVNPPPPKGGGSGKGSWHPRSGGSNTPGVSDVQVHR